MSNVRALKTKFVTPQMVMDNIAKEYLPENKLKAVYVVAFDQEGEPVLWASGDLGQLCHAAILLNDYAARFAKGEIHEEA